MANLEEDDFDPLAEINKSKEEPQQDEFKYDNEGDAELSGDLERFYFKLKKKGDPIPVRYYLEELEGESRDRFLDSQKSVVNLRDNTIRNYKDLQTRLLAYCTHYAEDDKLVPAEVIRKFPSSSMSKLYTKALKLSYLNRDAESLAKNG